MTYCGLKLCLKQLLHEDAFVLWSILLTFCADVLERRYTLPYFEDANLYSIITNAIQDSREGDANSSSKDLLTWTALAITDYYFEDHTIPVLKSSKDLLVFLSYAIKERVASQFLRTMSPL
jgi:hypothetical protein